MDQQQFNETEQVVDDLYDELRKLLDEDAGKQVRKLMLELSSKLKRQFGVSLQVVVDIVDWEREAALPLIQTGLSVGEDNETYQTNGDSSPHRYLVDGEIIVVPHDYCPKCWKSWAWKFENPTCPHCQATLGEDVFILLDRDLCPNCEEGKLTASNPVCGRCDFVVDPTYVNWG